MQGDTPFSDKVSPRAGDTSSDRVVITPSQGGRRLFVTPQRLARRSFKGSKKKRKSSQRRMWRPRVLRPGDVEAGEAFMATWGISKSARDRVRADYGTFCELNSYTTNSVDAMQPWVGQMTVDGLAPGTIDTYAGYVKSMFPRDHRARNVHAATQRHHADADTQHAPNVAEIGLYEYARRAKGKVMKSLVEVELLTGIRLVAARGLRRSQIYAPTVEQDSEHILTVQLRIDKNIKKRTHRATLRIPRAWFPDGVSESTLKYLREGDADERLFSWATNGVFSREMLAIERAHGLPHATAGSFRRLFMNRVFENTGGDKAAMKKFTLHHSEYVTEAHYVSFAGVDRAPAEYGGAEEDDEEEEEIYEE